MAVSTLPARKEHEIKIPAVLGTINGIKWKMTVATTIKTSRLWYSGFSHRVLLWADAYVSEEYATSIFRVEEHAWLYTHVTTMVVMRSKEKG
jgi:hypothetical protein